MWIRRHIIVTISCWALFVSTAAAQTKVRNQFGVRIPMRDGINLVADIYMPSTEGKYPAILEITPYGRGVGGGFREEYRYWTQHGYALVIVDDRGRGDSGGTFDWFVPDINDGYDVVEWIAAQPWSSGKVGMRGASYTGTNQWYAAKNRPPHLACINPNATVGRPLHEMPYDYGAFRLGWALSWIDSVSDHAPQAPLDLDWDAVLKHRPLLTLDEFVGRPMPMMRTFLQHSTMDDYWKRVQFTEADFRRIEIPTLAATGWYDGTQPGTIFYYKGIKKYSPARDQQYLVIGPWVHATAPNLGHDRSGHAVTQIADLKVPNESVLPLDIIYTFFDSCLKGGIPFRFPAAKVYLTGSNHWIDLPAYPPSNAKVQALYLRSKGGANTLNGDGVLSWEAPAASEASDRFEYDPKNPVPDYCGDKGNVRDGFKEFPVDLAPLFNRADELVYVSEPLAKPVTVLGNVELVLVAASDARDTDFTSFLEDVGPNGRGMKLGPLNGGQIRARYRNGFDREELLTPNQPTELTIDYFDIGHTFLAGHRIRVSISSSTFPYITANPNTGNPIATDTEAPRIAHQRVFHDAAHPSRILLPVMPEP